LTGKDNRRTHPAILPAPTYAEPVEDHRTITITITERLRAVTAEQLSLPPAELRSEARLAGDLGVDSLAAIEWGMTVEDAFGIALPEDAWESVTTYGLLEQLVVQLVADHAPDVDRALQA